MRVIWMYYDEDYYLYPYYNKLKVDSSVDIDFLLMIHNMYKLRDAGIILKEKSCQRHDEKFKIYDEFILLVAKLIKEIGIKNNEISYSLIIGLLLKAGMFSDWHRFEYKTNIVENLYGCLGLQVIRGYGTCRHISSFYKDVFDKLGLYNDKLYNYFSESNNEKIAKKNNANHVVNIIRYNDGYYGIDLANDYIFEFVNELKMKSMFKKEIVYIFGKPYMDILVEGLSYEEMENKLNNYRNNINRGTLDKKEYFDILRDTRESILRSEDILLDFNNDRRNYIKRLIYK